MNAPSSSIFHPAPCCLWILFALAGMTPISAAEPRISVTIDREWTFMYQPAHEADPAWAKPEAQDRTWPVIALPHTWQTFETTREMHPYIRNANEDGGAYWWLGWGWYRKHFQLEPALSGRRVRLEFDGVMKRCQIWMNGVKLGEHAGGYDSFSLDATAAVRFGEDNVLAVAVSNTRNDPEHTPPMAAGNFNVYGGIYRSIRLVLTDPVHIPFQGDFASEGGTHITTPQVTAERATWQVRTWVRNAGATTADCVVEQVVADPAGREVGRSRAVAKIAAGALQAVEDAGGEILTPRLWSPETPALYTVSTSVLVGGRLCDRLVSPLGFRWFSWEPRGLVLNGKPVRIAGVNRHQEYPWLGDAIPWWISERDLVEIRRVLNFNFMRTSHYPQDPRVYDWCDRNGILLCEEVPNIKTQPFSEKAKQQQAVSMVRRDRNHPSIVMWSIGNETNSAADPAWIKAEDPSRIVHARHVRGGRLPEHTHKDLEIEQLLKCTIRGWTDDAVFNIPSDVQQAGNETLQHDLAVKSKILGTDLLCVWLYADHGADRIYPNCPLKFVNPKGWVDSWRVPKYIHHLWRAWYAEGEVLEIHGHAWTRERLGTRQAVTVDTNCSEVELIAAGTSLGVKPVPPTRTLTFPDVVISEGDLVAVGRRQGKEVIRRTQPMAGLPARLVLTASHRTVVAAQDGIVTVMADVVDAAGRSVPGAKPTLTWSVDGPATLVGPDRYESDIDKRGQLDGTMYITCPVGQVVRASNTPGRIRLSVAAEGLQSGAVEILSEAPSAPTVGVIQPPLDPSGRLAVPLASRPRTGQAVVHLALEPGDLTLTPNRDGSYADAISAHLAQGNPKADIASQAFLNLVQSLDQAFRAHRGTVIRDDLNFSIARFNETLGRTPP